MKISVVIPCYNEELWVSQAVNLLLACQSVSQIICVNDGSKDKTEAVLASFGQKITLISYKKNRGKGYAMSQGIMAAKEKIVVFMDAHHLNVKESHLQALTAPLLKNYDCVLGVTIINILPDPFWRFTGFRAYRKADLLLYLQEMEKSRFGVETYLNDVFKDKKTKVIKFKDLIHLVKQQIMPPEKMLRGYLLEFREMAKTMAKTKGFDYEKVKDLLDPGKIKSVRSLKRRIAKINNKGLLGLIKKYILAYLTTS